MILQHRDLLSNQRSSHDDLEQASGREMLLVERISRPRTVAAGLDNEQDIAVRTNEGNNGSALVPVMNCW